MALTIVCMGLAGEVLVPGGLDLPIGQYLKSYDPEAHDGRGFAEWTGDINEAMVFKDIADAHQCWTAIPNCRPTREDGRPNRPLTAFSIVLSPSA